ncbi:MULTISPECIES: outer membrane protein assembly factor BamE domain-containing protein [Bacillus]|uniref:Outer membrane protein assembly factor BamE domain-containing protein n=2 Tax=Bacillus TaxID=1386 RepID=A0A0M4FY69_9BACI|nr:MULTISPECIES: outer membrane protein assembly factor BamE [Bacillus]ALC84030.1 hypothetical protein AM592_22935 [Bacillus gobiensis]MBP1082869.1 hypothetical protein [Bacillus capparidis]MED1098144.1 outer membrane protein assembly factor BamE [Bacillus capparidis]
MKSKENLLWGLLCVYGILYVLLYMGYYLIINILHSSYSVISTTAIILPFVFLLLFLLILWKYTEIRKAKFLAMTAIGIIPPLYCAIILGVNEYRSNFTVEKWVDHENERVYMIDDFFNTYDLIGMEKDEVNSLLGKPTVTEYFKEDDNIVYYLGDERGLIRIDSEWLVLRFNDEEQVVNYEIRTD